MVSYTSKPASYIPLEFESTNDCKKMPPATQLGSPGAKTVVSNSVDGPATPGGPGGPEPDSLAYKAYGTLITSN